MANFNKVILMGNLTRDVEMRTTQGGTSIAKLGMAINRKWSGQGGEQKETTCFVDMTAFGKQAELLNQYVGKGSPLFVEGRLEYSTWESQDGGKKSKLEVIIENFQFLGGARGAGGGDEQRRSPARRSNAAGGGGGDEAGGGGGGGEANYGDIPF